MPRASGSADLPLHGGRVPPWLAQRMTRLGRIITEAICLHYGRDAFLSRLSHPFWFQSFGAVMGMDWHSSGITTSVMGALKRGLAPIRHELGLHVCGGRGRHSRRTPDELRAVGVGVGLDGDELARTSKLVAKVDSAAVQDGFALYLHSFVVADDGKWTVVQQGMSDARGQARRYHWMSDDVDDFVDEPHSAIDGEPGGAIINLADHRALPSRGAQLELIAEGPDRILQAALKLRPNRAPLPRTGLLPHLQLPDHHDVREEDVVMRRLRGAITAAHEAGPRDFADLLLTPGVGARTMLSLALVAEVVHGAPCRFSDPARFSMAHGGKDGHPFPVPLKVYDKTLGTLRDAITAAKLGNRERLDALQRLDRQARALETTVEHGTPLTLTSFITTERRRARDYGGRTVFDDRRPPRRDNDRQLSLPGMDALKR